MVLENVLLCSPERFLAIYEINVRLQSGKTFSLSKKLTNQPFGTPSKSEHLITLLEDSKQEPSQSVYNNSAALKGPKKLRVQDLRRAHVHRWNYLALNVGTIH